MASIYLFVAKLPVAGPAWFEKSAGISVLLSAVATMLPIVPSSLLSAPPVHFPLDVHWAGDGQSGKE